MVSNQPVKVLNPQPGVVYYEKFPEWIRKKYHSIIDSKCQFCHKHMIYKDMEIHRLKRKGYYTLCKLGHKKQNCKFIHKECHKLFHKGEPGHGSNSY